MLNGSKPNCFFQVRAHKIVGSLYFLILILGLPKQLTNMEGLYIVYIMVLPRRCCNCIPTYLLVSIIHVDTSSREMDTCTVPALLHYDSHQEASNCNTYLKYLPCTNMLHIAYTVVSFSWRDCIHVEVGSITGAKPCTRNQICTTIPRKSCVTSTGAVGLLHLRIVTSK